MTVNAKLFEALSEVSHIEALSYPVKTPVKKPVMKTGNRGAGAVGISLLLAFLLVAPVGLLPAPNDNVFAGITLLLSMTWLVSLSFAHKPVEAIFMSAVGLLGIFSAFSALSNPVWLWVAWSANVLAGGVLHHKHWVSELLEMKAVTGWVSFNIGMLLIVSAIKVI